MTDSIHVLMSRVLADLPAIGKNQMNQQQGFKFRGFDDVIDALNPLLAKHGVFFVPTVLERIDSHRQTRNGGTLWVVALHVQYTFYGPNGDSVTATGWGEGTDSGDKATQKAMTGALKYVLFQTFAIATKETADSDTTTPEETISPKWRHDLAAKATELQGEGVDIGGKRKEWNLPMIRDCNGEQLAKWEELLRDCESEREAPFTPEPAVAK